MISLLGQIATDIALVAALAGAAAGLAGCRVDDRWMLARRAAYLVAALVAVDVLLMEIALVGHDYSVRFVADVGGPGVPLYYTIISLWGALEGSILFWALLLSLYTVVYLRLTRYSLTDTVTGVLLTVSAFFLFVIAGPGDPFTRVDPRLACQTGCRGPNPLLQDHWLMGVHPPLLYLGYVGLAVPFAIAITALFRGAPAPEDFRMIRRWALIPWIFLSLGIVAGMWWSYAVLGWGGYWSWDPVENASVMPWLVTTAFLHSLQVQERRQMLKTWTISLIVSAFLLSVLGTFLTRSGVLASVHSFTQSGIGPVFLGFFAVVLAASLGLLFARSHDLAAAGVLEATVCRETAFLVNNLLLGGITFTVLLGTLFPLIAQALQGTQLAVGAPYFNHVAVPIAFALLFLMGIGPALPWGATRFDELQYRLLGPVAVGVTVILLLLALGVRGIGPLVTFGLVGFGLTVTLGRISTDVGTRRRGTREGTLAASGRLFASNPRRYGGYLAHIGVLLVVVGIAASQAYQSRATVTLRPGQSATVAGYTLAYHGWQPRPESDRMVIRLPLDVRRGSTSLGRLTPGFDVYPSEAVVVPGVREEPFALLGGVLAGQNPLPLLAPALQGHNPIEDLYIVPEAQLPRRANAPIAFQVLVNPLVGLIWCGGFVLALGGCLALVPARRRRRVQAPALEPAAVVPEEVTA